MKNPKELIISEYKKKRIPISIEEFCMQYSDDEFLNIGNSLSDAPVVDSMLGLSPDEVYELIKYYGNGFLFSRDIEKNVYEYIATRKELEIIEKKRSK